MLIVDTYYIFGYIFVNILKDVVCSSVNPKLTNSVILTESVISIPMAFKNNKKQGQKVVHKNVSLGQNKTNKQDKCCLCISQTLLFHNDQRHSINQ